MASADGNAVPPTDPMDTAPTLCAKGCGFFGNSATGGMCSKCYKETIAKAGAAATAAAPAPTAPTPPPAAPAAAVPAPKEQSPTPPVAETSGSVTSPAPAAKEASAAEEASSSAAAKAAEPASSAQVRPCEGDAPEDVPPRKVQVKTSRCWTCNRKIGLTGFQCKCEYFFCAEHRYSDKHACDFDYKAQGKQLLSKANPTIAPSKMESM